MLIKNMIEDLGSPGEEPIPIMNVSYGTSTICRFDVLTAAGHGECPEEGARMVYSPQERSCSCPRRRERLPQEDHRYR